MLDGAPVGLRLVIIVNAEVVVTVPVPTGALVVLRRLFELVLGKVGPISTEFCTSRATKAWGSNLRPFRGSRRN